MLTLLGRTISCLGTRPLRATCFKEVLKRKQNDSKMMMLFLKANFFFIFNSTTDGGMNNVSANAKVVRFLLFITDVQHTT